MTPTSARDIQRQIRDELKKAYPVMRQHLLRALKEPSEPRPDSVTPAKMAPGQDPTRAGGGAEGVPSLRATAGNGASKSVSHSDHSHSISFKTLATRARRSMIERRAELRDLLTRAAKPGGALGEGRAVRGDEAQLALRMCVVMARLVLGLCHMAMDDPDVTAEERERLVDEDPDFAREDAEADLHDYGDGMEPRKKGRFNREVHPDLLLPEAKPSAQDSDDELHARGSAE